MTFTIKEKDSQNKELTVELNKEDLERYVRETEDVIGNDLQVEGFRKGKAPREVVRKHIGESIIRENALQTAMQRSLGQILAEEELDVVEASGLSIKENSPDKLIYTVNVRLFPSVKLPDLETIKVARRAVSVEPKEIGDALETIRASRADVTDTEEPAALGDRVEVDFEVRDMGQLIDGGISKNHPLVIGKKNFMPGFEDQLIGLKKRESKEFSLKTPEDFANKTIAGKNLDFKVTMQKVQHVALPPLDDTFAQKLGKFNNIDQFILNMKEGLLQEKEDKESQRVRLAVVEEVVKGTTCDISDQMVSDQLDSMMKSFGQDLQKHDMELSLYLAKIGKTQEDLRKDWKSDAKRQVAMTLVIHALARQKEIQVAPEDVNAALESLVQSTVTSGNMPSNFDVESLRQNIQSRLLTEKTLQYLESTCVLTA